MTQGLILKKLHAAFSKANPNVCELLITTDEKKNEVVLGHCFGFSLAHAAMNRTGYRDWWHHALFQTATNNDLKAEVKLPNSRSLQPQTVEGIKSRVLNYVVHLQCGISNNYPNFIEDLEQDSILDPNKKFFEIVDAKGDIKTIQKKIRIAGHFTKEQLLNLFDEKIMAGTICLIHTENKDFAHTINVHETNLKWHVYDPNYPHDKLDTITKPCENKHELISEIIRIQGPAVCFEIATFDANKSLAFPYYDTLIEKEGIHLLNGFGLHHMAKFRPDLLKKILTSSLKQQPESKLDFIELVKSTVLPDCYSMNGLHQIAQYAPDSLPEFLKIILQNKDGDTAFIQALQAFSRDRWTGFQMVARYAPQCLSQIITLLEKNPAGLAALINVIQASNQDGWTGFQMVTRFAPQCLSPIITLLEKNPAGLAALINFIQVSNQDRWTGFQMVAQYAPQCLSQIVTLLASDKAGLAALIKIIQVSTQDGWTGFQAVAGGAPQCLSQIITLLEKNPAGLAALINVIQASDQRGWTGFQTAAGGAPQCLSQIITLLASDKAGLAALFNVIQAPNREGWTGFQTAAKCAPQCLSQIITLLASDKAGPDALFNVIKATNPEGWTEFQMIARYAPQCLSEIITLLASDKAGLDALINVIQASDRNGVNGFLFVVMMKTPQCLSQIITLLASDETGRAALTNAAKFKNRDGENGLDYMIHYASKMLPMLQDIIASYESKKNHDEKKASSDEKQPSTSINGLPVMKL